MRGIHQHTDSHRADLVIVHHVETRRVHEFGILDATPSLGNLAFASGGLDIANRFFLVPALCLVAKINHLSCFPRIFSARVA